MNFSGIDRQVLARDQYDRRLAIKPPARSRSRRYSGMLVERLFWHGADASLHKLEPSGSALPRDRNQSCHPHGDVLDYTCCRALRSCVAPRCGRCRLAARRRRTDYHRDRACRHSCGVPPREANRLATAIRIAIFDILPPQTGNFSLPARTVKPAFGWGHLSRSRSRVN